MEQLGTTIDGQYISEDDALKNLSEVIDAAHVSISNVSHAFHESWKSNPSTGVRAAFGHWLVSSARHVVAVTTLVQENDLVKVAEVHYRQMLEILFQVRKVASTHGANREHIVQKVAAWGVLDYLEKMEFVKDTEWGRGGYEDVEQRLELFDVELVLEIKKERKRSMYWFGKNFSSLAKEVTRQPEDLAKVYHVVSAQAHGAWDLALDVINPAPGHLDFRGYQNKAQLYYWSAELLDRVYKLNVQIWNEIATAVDAPQVATSENI
jgi:hypothetical protein